MTLQTGVDGEEAALPERLRAALGAAAGFRILSTDRWSPHAQVAERYREGRVFLAGDAAHRFPPTGGLGLDTGILDVDVLVHHLVQVEAGRSDPGRLDAYEAACRPAAQTNAQESLANLRRLAEIQQVLGPCPDLASLEARVSSLCAEEKAQLAAAIETQRSHFLSDGRMPGDPRGASR